MLLDNTRVKGKFELFVALIQEGQLFATRDSSSDSLSSVCNYILNQNLSLYCLCIEKKHAHKILCTHYIKRKQVATVLSPSANRTQYKTEVAGIERKATGMIRSAENPCMNRLKWLGELGSQSRHLKENIIVVKVRNSTGKIDKNVCWDSSVPWLSTRLWRHSVKL